MKKIALLLVRAGWHTSLRLRVPDHVYLHFLPSYFPQQQPAEHLWPLTNAPLINRHFARTAAPFRSTHEFSITLLAFNLWVHPGDSMQVGKRNPLGTVTFTGIDFAAHRQTRVGALL